MAKPALERRLTKRRLFGLDRSGPAPRQTLSDQPLRPWTIPNAIGYVRLALIPLFVLADLATRHGRGALPAVVFAIISCSDYLDGFAARLTGQYSRLGALLDPIVDRLLVVSGMAVAWRFSLLPRWAIAIVIARELFVLALSRYGLRRGAELKINWPGRVGVAPMMGAPFFAIVGLHAVAEVMLFVGLALTLTASVLYVRSGLAHARAQSEPDPPGTGGAEELSSSA